MKFRTEIEITPFEEKIDYTTPILALGSCFAAEIGGRIERAKLPITINPTGVLFNPSSIAKTLEWFVSPPKIAAEDLIEREGLFSHYQVHGSLSALSAEQCIAHIEAALERGSQALRSAEWVIITLGSAWVYELNESAEVVANCHKMPARLFHRRALSLEQIVQQLSSMMSGALSDKRVIFTLSPVRHLSDGLVENSLSKALLRVAIAQLQERYANAFYFPSYEILVDDLRDYRFYGDDMAHPSSAAIDYVWEKFSLAALTTQAQATLSSVERVARAVSHRPFNPNSQAHRRFIRTQLDFIASIDGVDLSDEISYFNSQLHSLW